MEGIANTILPMTTPTVDSSSLKLKNLEDGIMKAKEIILSMANH
jgi:hypothetical protein